jgi:HAD superfamily hydrolase (TIGR01509 family)
VQDRFLGKSKKAILTYLDANVTDGATDGFAARWEAVLFEEFRRALKPIHGVSLFLDRLETKAIRFCIASSGSFERIEIALNAVRMTDRFPHIFSADQVARGKPAPDLFEFAARQIAVPPERCLVIEDSPYGVAAAKAAGMRCIAFVGGTHLARQQDSHGDALVQLGADTTIRSYTDLLAKAE